jgi:transcription elongation factor Elf1
MQSEHEIMKDGLIKCPFCKNDACVVDSTVYHHYVSCLKCEARGPLSDTIEEAKTAWNRGVEG